MGLNGGETDEAVGGTFYIWNLNWKIAIGILISYYPLYVLQDRPYFSHTLLKNNSDGLK